MDANQLNELANNAELNHWPAHLGVTTDAEKVGYLAARLREVATERSNQLEAAEQRIEYLEGESIDIENKIDRLSDENEKLEAANEELKDRIASMELQLKEAEETIGQLEARL